MSASVTAEISQSTDPAIRPAHRRRGVWSVGGDIITKFKTMAKLIHNNQPFIESKAFKWVFVRYNSENEKVTSNRNLLILI
jgi:hypothetical protein